MSGLIVLLASDGRACASGDGEQQQHVLETRTILCSDRDLSGISAFSLTRPVLLVAGLVRSLDTTSLVLLTVKHTNQQWNISVLVSRSASSASGDAGVSAPQNFFKSLPNPSAANPGLFCNSTGGGGETRGVRRRIQMQAVPVERNRGGGPVRCARIWMLLPMYPNVQIE